MRSLRRLALPLVCLVGTLAGVGCATDRQAGGQTFTMTTSPKLPAADGRARVRVDADGNHVIELSFQRLAPPGRAFEGTTMYMVWLVPRSAGPQAIGSLDVADDQKAKVTIRTPNENFDVLVTAEVNAFATTPSRNRAFVVEIRSASPPNA